MIFKRAFQRYGRTPAPEIPFQRAGQVWDDRIGSARIQARNWRLMAFGTLGMAGVMASALVRSVVMIMLDGRMPSTDTAAVLTNRSANYASDVMTAGAKMGKDALAPVHRTATGNARRLKRARPR
jgi:hypothetical protein